MQAAVVAISCPIELRLFEVYAAMELDTHPLNTFRTHERGLAVARAVLRMTVGLRAPMRGSSIPFHARVSVPRRGHRQGRIATCAA